MSPRDDEGMGTEPEGGLSLRAWLATILAAVLAVAGIGTGISLVDDDGPGPHRGGTITVGTANGKKVAASERSVQAAAHGAEDYLLGPGNPTVAQQRSSDEANPQGPRVSGPAPLASPFQRGCLTRSNRYNWSYRNGVRPSIIVVHLPVAFNHPGWDDVNGVHVFLDQASTMASTNFQNDAEGHCIYSVWDLYKAWGQANYNSATKCSIEQQGYGTEGSFFGVPIIGPGSFRQPGLHQLAVIVHDCAKRGHIKLQRAVVDGRGGVIKEGVTDHLHLRAGGGGHVDISNFGLQCVNRGGGTDTWACVDLIIRAARAIDAPKPITAGQRRRCRELDGLRARARRPHTTLSARERARGKAIRTGLHAHRLRCLPGGHLKRA